jgi:PhzF family phenazine biosynthesis protein
MTDTSPAIRQFVVDAFTDRPFGGNPAAVVLLDAPAPAEWMQALAAENNLSETAYLVPNDRGWDLRWFTPAVEVDLCGHATLASSHVLFAEEGAREPTLRFATRSGELVAERGDDGWIELDLPANQPEPGESPHGVMDALGLDAGDVLAAALGRAELILLEVASADLVRSCSPDFAALAAASPHGVIVTALGDEAISAEVGRPVDLVSRFFAPAIGIDEDPVTGAAHCLLGPYWSGRLGRTDLLAVQVSARRGIVRVGVRGERVRLGGQAFLVSRAVLATMPPG